MIPEDRKEEAISGERVRERDKKREEITISLYGFFETM